MRRITLLMMLLAIVGVAFGQRTVMQEMQKTHQTNMVEHFTKAEWNAFSESKAYGDVIWSEDFSGGALPTGWTNVDNNSLGNIWLWSDNANPGQGGQYSTNTSPFASTSGGGYMVLPGDDYNTPLPASAVNMDAYITTAAINCDTATSVMLKFEQFFRYCCSNDAVFQVSVSTDNINWYHYDVLKGVANNITSANADVVFINLTPIAAGEQTVYIRFYQAEVSHYFWAIDDIQLIEAPANDIKFADLYNYFFDGTVGVTGSYSELPASQLMSNVCAADVYNYGDDDQHNVTFEAKLINNNTTVFEHTDDTVVLSFNDTAEFFIDSTYMPAATANEYTVAYRCFQTETDEIPEDNIADTISWKITDNAIIKRDRQDERWIGGNVSVEDFTGGLDGDFLGVEFPLVNNDTVQSISVYIDYRTEVGSMVLGQIYKDDGSTTVVIESDELMIDSTHLGTWVDLPMLSLTPGDNILQGGTLYYAGVECYPNGNELLIATEGEDYPHLLWYEAKLRVGTTWYWIHELPYVRLNMSSAVLQPQFKTGPQLGCGTNQTYGYIATIEDPQGLPLNVTAVTTQTGLSLEVIPLVNNEYVIITNETPNDAGLGLDDQFRIRITADNGVEKNEQYFWVTVVDYVTPIVYNSIDEEDGQDILIYPNPANNVLNVTNVGGAEILVYNLVGELVTSIERANQNETINIEALSAGTYIITVVKDNEVITNKFNKQ